MILGHPVKRLLQHPRILRDRGYLIVILALAVAYLGLEFLQDMPGGIFGATTEMTAPHYRALRLFLGALSLVCSGFFVGRLYTQYRMGAALRRSEDERAGLVRAYHDLQIQHAARLQHVHSEHATQLEAHAAELRTQTLRHQALIDAIPLPVFYKNLEGQLLEVNRAWERFFQCSRHGARALALDQLFAHAPDTARILTLQDHILICGTEVYREYELSLPLANGETRQVIYHTQCYRDASGEIAGTVGIISDVSERLQTAASLAEADLALQAARQRIQHAQEQLVQSEKMASIGQLAAGVAHEINNPVGYVYSNLNALDRYVKDVFAILSSYEQAETAITDPDMRAAIQREKHNADMTYLKEDLPNLLAESREGLERVKKIVQDLKDFSRKSSDDEAWQITDVHKCLDSTINIVWNELKYKCDLKRDYGVLPEIECQPGQLNQVLMNMLVNAGHAIDSHGTISVGTGTQDDMVWIAIRDTGAGIAPENLTRIFDPFFTTKPVGQGTGLGLALSYGIIQKHNGRIEVESQLGQGTTFRIWLPLQHREEVAPAA